MEAQITDPQVKIQMKKNMLFSRCEVGKMKEAESNILKDSKYTMATECLLLNAWDAGPKVEGIHADRDVRGPQRLTAGVNTSCHLLITFYTDSYRLHCKPSTSLIARCC